MKRCSKGIAQKACTNPKTLNFGDDDVQCLNVLANNIQNSKLEDQLDNWCFEDVSLSRRDDIRLDNWTEKMALESYVSFVSKKPTPKNIFYWKIHRCLSYASCKE